MELLLEEGSIARQIKKLRPSLIVTAYIGRGWPNYVDITALEEIVLSPTVGSSCAAIWDLVEALGGFENIHFLNELHAKFYWSKTGAVLGSSNLSDNGLQGEGGLVEAAVSMNSQDHARQCAALKALHGKLVARAKKQYPDERAKRDRLEWLQQVQHRSSLIPGFPSIGAHLGKKQSQGRELNDFKPALRRERIHIAGWSYEMHHNEGALREQLINESARSQRHAFKNYISLGKKDDVRQGDWVLCWKSREDLWEPMAGGAIYWLYVDRVLASTTGNEDDDPYVAHEFRPMRKDEVPFLLTPPVKKAIRALLKSGQFLAHCRMDAGFKMKAADREVPAFISALKQAVAET